MRVTLLAKTHAAPLLRWFAPEVEHVALHAPWSAFRRKYQLHRWPWRTLTSTVGALRTRHFDLGVSGRRDPRDHALLALSRVHRRIGFPRRGSGGLLTSSLPLPSRPHRAEYWNSLAAALEIPLAPASPPVRRGRRIVLHPGAAHPVRIWPEERFRILAQKLTDEGWEVVWIDSGAENLETLLTKLASADRFIGNDSGPGHLAALLGVPTFTLFGNQLPELFAPVHPSATWVTGAPCPHKPCFDSCRFPEPFCIRELDADVVWPRLKAWLG